MAPGQATADADWDTAERQGSLDAVVEKIHQAGEATVASAGAGWVDDFRLWGATRCRQTDAPPKKPRWRVQVARAFNNRNAFLSEGGALAVVVEGIPETRRRG